MTRKGAHKVVVVGAGFAGLQFVHDMKRADAAITLVDRRNHHLFQPLLYQVATTVLATSEIAWPIRHLYRDRKDVETLFGEVVGVDRANRQLLMKEGEPIAFDTLVLATGSRHAYFGNDHWEAYAPGLKRLEDATGIRRRILLAFEKAERETDPVERDALLTFVIVGAGPTGVELAGMIAELAHHTLPEEFRRIDTKKARILLIEGGPRVLPVFDPSLSDYAKASLERLGVEVMLKTPVTNIGPEGVNIGETFIACRTILWAAGVQASPAAKWLGAEADRAGRVMVGPDLTLPDDPNIFVLGDTAAVMQDGKPVPGLAPAAKQQGAYAAKLLRRRLAGKSPLPPFRYHHQGNLATIGKHAAIIENGGFRLRGWLAWWLWGIAHIYFLIGTRWRIAVAWSWLWTYVSGVHSARLITHRQTIKAK